MDTCTGGFQGGTSATNRAEQGQPLSLRGGTTVMAAARRLVLASAAWAAVEAFVPTSQNYNFLSPAQIRANGGLTNYVWTTPTSEHDTSGLGGGLTYAWDPYLCDQLIPHFGERNVWGFKFVTCKSLRAAMERSFASWEANHPYISFNDITNQCDKQNATPPDRAVCALAEISITNNTRLVNGGADQAATTLVWTHTAASPSVNSFNYMNGQSGYGLQSISRATVGFSVDICWYLDSTFCNKFHSLKSWIGAQVRAPPAAPRSRLLQ